MNRHIITSPAFTGEINVLYGMDNKLLYIDFLKCDLSEVQTQFFKEKVPVIYTENFPEAFGKSRLTIIQEGYQVSFEQWWIRYNLKRNRLRAEKLWQRLSEADKVSAYFKIGMYERHLTLNNWKTKADPERYLKERYWDNEWNK